MRFTVNSDVIEEQGFTMQEFLIILYYISGGRGVANEEICNALWQRNLLEKVVDGFRFNHNSLGEIEAILAKCGMSDKAVDRTEYLANKLREIYPEGKKAGTIYYWRDSTKVISQRLQIFLKKYGDNYSNESIINATKKYVESFNGDYRYMQLLKYFIRKRNNTTGEDTSELLSYLENAGQEDSINDGWTTELR